MKRASSRQKTGLDTLQWYETIYELIDLRSFSNLWYWIGLSVVWSTASHWVIGVPYDLVRRARRFGGEAEADMRTLVRINVGRILYIMRMSGLWIMGLMFFMISGLLTLAIFYSVEFAQAVLFIFVPMCAVGALSVHTASGIAAVGCDTPDLYRRLHRHRMIVQTFGMVSIFFTAVFGMYQNMQLGVFG